MNYSEMERLDLFRGLNSTEISHICNCFGTSIVNYKKNETVVGEGEKLKKFGIVLAGTASSFKIDISGKVFTVAVIKKGGYIGAFLASDSEKHSPVTVMATDRLTVLFIPFKRLVQQCGKNCSAGSAHTKVLTNFITGVCEKAMLLFERIDCLIKPTIREKAMAYLVQQSNGQATFDIPFNREQLAEYLNTERSALSRELSNMKKDSLIDYKKNFFEIL